MCFHVYTVVALYLRRGQYKYDINGIKLVII